MKKYKFEIQCERVSFTPLCEIFSEADIRKIKKLGLKTHECHNNSFKIASLFKCEYCEGVFMQVLDHAFNRIKKGDKWIYFDATDFINTGDSTKVPSMKVVMLRSYKLEDVLEVFSDFSTAFVTTGCAFNEKLGSFTIDNNGHILEINSASRALKVHNHNAAAYNKALKKT